MFGGATFRQLLVLLSVRSERNEVQLWLTLPPWFSRFVHHQFTQIDYELPINPTDSCTNDSAKEETLEVEIWSWWNSHPADSCLRPLYVVCTFVELLDRRTGRVCAETLEERLSRQDVGRRTRYGLNAGTSARNLFLHSAC